MGGMVSVCPNTLPASTPAPTFALVACMCAAVWAAVACCRGVVGGVLEAAPRSSGGGCLSPFCFFTRPPPPSPPPRTSRPALSPCSSPSSSFTQPHPPLLLPPNPTVPRHAPAMEQEDEHEQEAEAEAAPPPVPLSPLEALPQVLQRVIAGMLPDGDKEENRLRLSLVSRAMHGHHRGTLTRLAVKWGPTHNVGALVSLLQREQSLETMRMTSGAILALSVVLARGCLGRIRELSVGLTG